MDVFKKGWFSEVSETEFPGQAQSLEVEEVLHDEETKFQDVLIFKSKIYGTVLALDGVIQCTERDEFSYHEMITHVPMFCHPNPKSVLVVGGGDGGTLREVAKHSSVEEIHICELDERVIELSKKFLPQTAVGFSSPKVHVHIQDGMEFMSQNKKKFDIIITDSSDCDGPAEILFEKPYYECIKASLKDGGILCSQGDTIWVDADIPLQLTTICRELFPVVGYAVCTIPTYLTALSGFVLASNNKDVVLESPVRRLTQAQVEAMGLQYYDSDVHRAAFTLPQFAKNALSQTLKKNGDE